MSTFPGILSGAVVSQLPFGLELRASVARVKMESGKVYAYYWEANPPASWELNFSVLTTSELAALRAHWEGRGGAWDSFSFTDPDTGTVYTCNYEGDDFAVSYLGVGQYALKLTITEVR